MTPKLQPGMNALLSHTPAGPVISNPFAGVGFGHPWNPVLVGFRNGAGVRLSKGIVTNIEDGKMFEPTIGGVPMSGTEKVGAPTLALDPSVAAANESWVLLTFTPNEKGLIDKDVKVEIVHRGTPGAGVGKTASIALAQIVWRDKHPTAVWPIVFFNLRYQRKTTATGAIRHFFL